MAKCCFRGCTNRVKERGEACQRCMDELGTEYDRKFIEWSAAQQRPVVLPDRWPFDYGRR